MKKIQLITMAACLLPSSLEVIRLLSLSVLETLNTTHYTSLLGMYGILFLMRIVMPLFQLAFWPFQKVSFIYLMRQC